MDTQLSSGKREDGLQAIGTKITRWFHKATEDVNNTLFYELSVKHALPNAYRVNVMEVIVLVACSTLKGLHLNHTSFLYLVCFVPYDK